MSALAFLMAGQGAQEVGMGVPETALCAGCRETLAIVDAALDFPLAALMANGPAEELQRTERAQPAILALSVAHAQHLLAHGVVALAVAGHSLGQYAALVVAGALRLADAARLVARRGQLMQEAVRERPGAMVAVAGLSREEARLVCLEASSAGTVVVACFNAAGRVVLSGDAAAVELAADACEERGAGVIPLPVSAPFHSPLLAPMVPVFSELVDATELQDPAIPVLDNVTGGILSSAAQAKRSLVAQVEAPVCFEENLFWLSAHGVRRVVQCGPGKSLLGFAARSMPGVQAETFAEHSRALPTTGGSHAGPL